MRITVVANGPYRVTGHVPLARQTIASDSEGNSIGWERGRDRHYRGLRALPVRSLSQQAILRSDPHANWIRRYRDSRKGTL